MSSSVEFVMSRSVKLQHKTLEHVVIRFYIGRLFPKLDENISEIIFPFPFNLIIISSTLALSIKIGYNITCSERIKEGYSKKTEPNSCIICLMLKYLPGFIRYAWITMTFSSTCIIYYISRTNSSVSIVQTRIFLYPLLIKFTVSH